jgi:YggT family protein
MGELIYQLAGIFITLVHVYIWVIIIGALLTWVNPDPHNPIIQILYRLTEPAYKFVRRFIPTVFNGVDLAPLIIVILLQVLIVLLDAGLRALLLS